ncbi:MAG: hypothetical protein A2521_03725 [Deltaproteobacteria bacterium RIFOXYD12_FULL_57_12]|nr:MAG: hypothetical protein A2521_03725 [Deltaproteobacteria bacterium RIFOXYD12_FULL_57_12]
MPRAAAHTHAHGADHDGHDHGHVHDHHAHTHGPGHDHGPSPGPAQAAPGPVPASGHDTWNLLLLGISGGLVPCPAGIATLLAAVAAGRIAQGLTVVIFFSLGLGLVMMAIGVVLSQAGRLASRIDSNQEFGRRIAILSAFIITGLGAVTLFHSVKTLWF